MEELIKTQPLKENKMGTMSVSRLLISMSLPMILSMLAQALYNIVDSIFVAMYDPIAGTAALTIAFPIQNLMIAVVTGLGVGMNALLSRSLGEKRFDRANAIAGQGFLLTFCGYLIFLVLGLFFVPAYVSTQSGTNELIQQYGSEYLSIVCIGCIAIFIEITCERLLQATGRTTLSMITQMSGVVVNIVLDPILIFSLDMGIAGAAIATVAGQAVSAILGVIFNLTCNKELSLRPSVFIPRGRLLKEILVIGIPSVLMQAIGSVMTYCMNKVLISFADCGVSAMNVFGIYFKLQSFIFMPIFGLNNGMVPIIAYNYGARKRDRVMKTIRLSMILAVSYMLLGLAAFHLFPSQLLGIFNADAMMLQIGVVALRRISLSFVFAGFCIITLTVCQALGKSFYSLITSIGRQLVVLIPTAVLFSLSGNVDLVWLAFPIAEIVSVILATFFMLRVLKKLLPKHLDPGT